MGRVDPRLISIVPGDVLDSVSRRDARRATVDVWTSGNRVFRCEATDVFGLIVDAVSAGVPAVGYVEQALGRAVTSEEHDHINDAVKRVIQIVDTECEEYVRHWEG
jgi:hypothetical protein